VSKGDKDIDWDAQPLGKDYDSVIAKRLGVTVKEVFRARKSRKILPFAPNRRTHKKIDWDAQPLGEEPDRVVAKRLGVSPQTVGYHRHARESPPSHRRGRPPLRIDWEAQPLGKESDRSIAKKLGISHTSVRSERRDRGIVSLLERNRHNIDWTKVEDLGTASASIIAKRLGLDRSIVVYHRKRLGIAAPTINKEERYRRSAQSIRETYTKQNESGPASITNRMTSEMGVTLTRLCEHLDLSASLVSAYRTGKMSGMGPSGFRDTARRFAGVYGVAPEQIWTEFDPLSQVDIGTDGLDEMLSPWPTPEEFMGQTDFAEFLPDLLESVLTPRERTIVSSRFAAHPKTLQEIGDDLSVSRERIRQVEFLALEKLRRAYGLKTTLRANDDNPSAGNVPRRDVKPGPKTAKPKRLPKPEPYKRTHRTCKEIVMDFFTKHPDSSFSAHQVVEKLKGCQHSNGTVTNAVYSLRDSGNIHPTSLGRYGFSKTDVTFRQKKAHKRGERTGADHVRELLDASPHWVFTLKEIQDHIVTLGYTKSTGSMYANRLSRAGKICNVSWGLYQSILTEPKTNDKEEG